MTSPTRQKFCIYCMNYEWKWFKPNRCVRILEMDDVTGQATETFDMELREARENFCKGEWHWPAVGMH